MYQQPPPVFDYKKAEAELGRDVADIAKRTALNDCMYRNMYRYQYIANFDLDEIVVPEMEPDYAHMLGKIESQTTPCSACKDERLSLTFCSRMYCNYFSNKSVSRLNSLQKHKTQRKFGDSVSKDV